jgi:site-specific DNA-methyltransferase (cytosine-N4-specific)
MTTPYYQDSTVTLYHGKNLDVLPTLAAGSVDCCVTSPPYYGLRDYGHPDQIGAEKSPAEFVEALRSVFAEVRRVLVDDGTLWLNLGDSYSQTSTAGGIATPSKTLGIRADGTDSLGDTGRARAQARQRMSESRVLVPDVGPKNLLGIPWRVAFALQDDGWILRNAIVWAKPNAMPESVTDRLSTRYEMLFMFSKSRRYWFDLDPIREEMQTAPHHIGSEASAAAIAMGQKHHGRLDGALVYDGSVGRNPGDVWAIPTSPFPGSHFAVFPPELPRRCIVAGCKPGGTVLDPFHGSGTTGMVATRNGRKYVGIELNREYIDLSLRTRLADGVLDFGEDTA